MAQDQTDYRWRNDDGSETTATWTELANTTTDVDVTATDVDLRLRFVVAETGESTLNPGTLEFSINGGAYTSLGSLTTGCFYFNSTNLTDGNDTTQQVGSGTFVGTNEGVLETGSGGIAELNNDEVEYEYTVTFSTTDLSDGDSINFRINEVGSYTVTANATITKGGGDTSISATTDALVLAEQAATIGYDVEVLAATDALVVATFAATIDLGVNVTAVTDALALTEYAATIGYDVEVLATTDALVLTENAADIILDIGITATTDALVLTENAATITTTVDTEVLAVTDALALTEYVASITYDVEVLANTDALVLAEAAAIITTTADVTIDATTDALSLVEQASTITLDVSITGTTDALVITTYAASIDLAVGTQEVITGKQMITTKKDSAFPLEVAVDSTGGVTGLSVTAAIRDVNNSASYLDFADGTFKTTGWTTKAVNLTDLGLGFYGTTLDISAITNLPTGKSLAIEYDISGSIVSIDHGVITFLDDYLTTGKYIGLS